MPFYAIDRNFKYWILYTNFYIILSQSFRFHHPKLANLFILSGCSFLCSQAQIQYLFHQLRFELQHILWPIITGVRIFYFNRFAAIDSEIWCFSKNFAINCFKIACPLFCGQTFDWSANLSTLDKNRRFFTTEVVLTEKIQSHREQDC